MKIKSKFIVIFTLILTLLLSLFLIGTPIKFKKISGFKEKKSVKMLVPHFDHQNVITVKLKGLKPTDIPLFNIHSLQDFPIINMGFREEDNTITADLENSSAIDFGALEELVELANLKPVYNGENLVFNSNGTYQDVYKVLTAKKKPNQVVALIDYKSIYVPQKSVKLNQISSLKFEDITSVVSDTLVYHETKTCYGLLSPGEELFQTCYGFVTDAPFEIEYIPEQRVVKIYPTDNNFWQKVGVYNLPILFTYGKDKTGKYLKKGKINKKVRLRLAKRMAKKKGAFVLDPNIVKNAARQETKITVKREERNNSFTLTCDSAVEKIPVTYDMEKILLHIVRVNSESEDIITSDGELVQIDGSSPPNSIVDPSNNVDALDPDVLVERMRFINSLYDRCLNALGEHAKVTGGLRGRELNFNPSKVCPGKEGCTEYDECDDDSCGLVFHVLHDDYDGDGSNYELHPEFGPIDLPYISIESVGELRFIYCNFPSNDQNPYIEAECLPCYYTSTQPTEPSEETSPSPSPSDTPTASPSP